MSGEDQKTPQEFLRYFEALKSANKKLKEKVFKKNLDTFKLLITDIEFQKIVGEGRKEIDGAADDENKLNILHDLDTRIIKKFNLPHHFREALSIFVQKDEINKSSIPNRNYDFRFNPRPQFNKDGYASEYVKTVHLITYTQLTDQEVDEAKKILKKIQKIVFPKTKLFGQLKPHKNIDVELEIERRGLQRHRRKTEEVYNDYYLELQSKKLSGKKLRELKRLNHFNIVKKKVPSYTSKKIAKELIGDHDSGGVRQIIKRVKKERQDRFNEKQKVE